MLIKVPGPVPAQLAISQFLEVIFYPVFLGKAEHAKAPMMLKNTEY